ncbi:thioredoxin-like protein [Kockiozyma suomiensis]|uniref:thioredoxin-like protein n=1 Tax=Kockiozyma suomiensis TaxID=1337062 RepID=UPI003343BAB3
MSAQARVREYVAKNPIMVFSKTYCPYCVHAKGLLKNESAAVAAKILELDEMGKEGSDLQNAVYQLYSHRTVPAIFIGGKFIGGDSDLTSLKNSGKLKSILAEL